MKKDIIYKGRVITFAVEETILPNGAACTFEVAHHPGGAGVVPIFDNGDILLIRQYRYPIDRYIWEIPAGKLDIPGEDPKDCVARELIEETGFQASTIDKLITFFPSPGFSDEVLHVYKATGLTPAKLNQGADEVIEIHRFAQKDVARLIAAREIDDSKTLIGLSLAVPSIFQS